MVQVTLNYYGRVAVTCVEKQDKLLPALLIMASFLAGDQRGLKFFYNKKRIKSTNTPRSLRMPDSVVVFLY